jgi:hypothetical protein
MAKIEKVSNQLRRIGEGEAFSARNEYLGNRKMKSTFGFRRSAGEPQFEKVITFDFAGLSEEQLIGLCMYGLKVKVQSMLRALEPAAMLDANTLSSVNVLKDILSVVRLFGTTELLG